MTKKTRSLVVYILAVFAVIFMMTSITVMTMYHSLLNANLYKEALYKSGIYTVTADIIERNVSVALVSWEKSLVQKVLPQGTFNNELAGNTVTFVLNTVIEQQTPELVSNVFDNIGLAEVFQNIVEKKIDNDIAWWKGEREMREVFTYIPTPEQIESLKGSSFTQLLDSFVKESVTDTGDLPACENDEQVQQNIALINNGDTKSVSCTSEKIKTMLGAKFEDSNVKTLVNKVGEGADTIAQNSRVDALLSDIYDLSLTLAQIKQSLLDARSMLHNILLTANILFWLSIILMIAATIVQKRGKQAKTFVLILFSSGAFITVFSLLYYVVLINFVIGSIPFNEVTFHTNALTATEGAMLMNSLEFIVNYIAKGAIYETFVVGVWMTVISALMGGALLVYKKRKVILEKFNA